MAKRAVYVYMAATCAMAIVAPGRFAIGIIFAIETLLLTVFGTIFRAISRRLKFRELRSTFLCCFLITLTICFKLLLQIFDAETALQLSFVIYLPAISTFSSVFLFNERNLTFGEEMKKNFVPSLIFSLFILLISLIRDVFGFGTFTLPCYKNMKVFTIFSEDKVSAGTFLATIPGAIVICAIFLACFLKVEQKVKFLEKEGDFQ